MDRDEAERRFVHYWRFAFLIRKKQVNVKNGKFTQESAAFTRDSTEWRNPILRTYRSSPRNCFANTPTTKEMTATLMLIPAISRNLDLNG